MSLCLHQDYEICLPYNPQTHPLSYLRGVKPQELTVYLVVYLHTMAMTGNTFGSEEYERFVTAKLNLG